jgi:5-methylcytosine-specific restriction endonuclease McrA
MAELQRAQYARDPQTARIKAAAKRERLDAALNERMRAWYAQNAEAQRAAFRKRCAANPAKYAAIRLAARHSRRARDAAAAGRFTAQDVAAIFVRQGGECAHPWCRKALGKRFHRDHIIALSRGGSNGRRNIQLLCVPCNLSKGSTDPVEFAQRHGLLL